MGVDDCQEWVQEGFNVRKLDTVKEVGPEGQIRLVETAEVPLNRDALVHKLQEDPLTQTGY